MKFNTYTLDELVTLKYGKSQKKVVSEKGTIPIYGTGGIMGYSTKELYNKPSVLIGRKGTIEKVHYVTHPFWTVDTLFYTIINENNILPHFLYYLLSLMDLKQLNEGTTIPSLRIETLNRIELCVPNLDMQREILSILEPIDDKIVLNNRINENLEKQAQSIFKSWFIDFDLYEGKFPENWKIVALIDIADFLNGLAMQKYRPSNNENGIPVLKIKELRQGFCDTSSDLCSPNIKQEYIINDGDVIFSWSGTLLVDLWCGGICGLNQHLFKVTSSKYDRWFYYLWIQYHLKQFITIAADKATTMGHIKRSDLEKAIVFIPTENEYKLISSILKPICDIIIENRLENRKLTLIRDTLLPKLMSGELDVSNIDI